MGNLCARRHAPLVNPHVSDDVNEAWIVVDSVPVLHAHRFKRVVRRVKHLLRLRKIWSRAGSWLNTAASKNPAHHRMRSIMIHIFTRWPQTVLKNTKPVFEHLKRERGKLVYK